MLYTDVTKTALKICYEAHSGQIDKSGLPYVFHPFHLAEQMETEDEICVARLHDVMEDTDLGDGDYVYWYEIVDILGNVTQTKPVIMHYQDGYIEPEEL